MNISEKEFELKIEEHEDTKGYKQLDKSVTEVCIPENYEFIAEGAFVDCKNLKSITIPENISKICKFAFLRCNNLETVILPDNGLEIESAAFLECTKLENIDIPDSIIKIGTSVFTNTAWWKNQPEGILYMSRIACDYKGNMQQHMNITIRDGTRAIAKCTLINSSIEPGKIESFVVTIPESVVYIGEDQFRIGSIPFTDEDQSKNEDFRKKALIRCYENSYGHEYAKENKINFEFI